MNFLYISPQDKQEKKHIIIGSSSLKLNEDTRVSPEILRGLFLPIYGVVLVREALLTVGGTRCYQWYLEHTTWMAWDITPFFGWLESVGFTLWGAKLTYLRIGGKKLPIG